MASGGFDPARITTDAGYVYVADRAGSRIARVPITGGLLQTVTPVVHAPFDVHADAGEIFIATSAPNQLWRVLNPQSELVAGLLEPNVPIAVDSQYIWWAVHAGRLLRVPR